MQDAIKRFLIGVVVVMYSMLISGCAASSAVQENPESAEVISLPSYTPKGIEPKIAVVDFKNGSFYESNTLGPGAASMVEAELVRSNRFVVVDRQNLEQILKEQKLSLSDLTNEKDYSKVGRLLNTDYVLSGTVSEFGVKTEGTSFTGSGSSTKSGLGGGIRLSEQKATARVVMDIKITNIATGQIVYVGTVIGEQSAQNSGAGILLITSTTAAGVGVVSGMQGFDQTLAGKASRVASTKFVRDLVRINYFKWN
ncbi:MAG: CsgG/HfaB family protein [Ignavibacteria bacterium]|nr:CsgG/HfaB family protein [Ignavibacteria bacterium]